MYDITKKLKSIHGSITCGNFDERRTIYLKSMSDMYNEETFNIKQLLERRDFIDIKNAKPQDKYSSYMVSSFTSFASFGFSLTTNKEPICQLASAFIYFIVITLIIVGICCYKFPKHFDYDFFTYDFEIALIDKYIEKNTGISKDDIIAELETKIQ